MFDEETCFRAALAKDPRFDGHFFLATASSGTYCRPNCPLPAPRRADVRFFPSSAAAQEAGFRSCNQCRPGNAPLSPVWNQRGDLIGRAVRLIVDGYGDRAGVPGLAARLGCSTKALDQQLTESLGAGTLALLRAQRAETARLLLEETDLPMAKIAFASGFSSTKELDIAMSKIFATTRERLRASSTAPLQGSSTHALHLRLSYREPIDLPALFRFLGDRAIPGVEDFDGISYRRVLALPHSAGTVELTCGSVERPAVTAAIRLVDARDLATAIARCRRLLDLDADPWRANAHLGGDPLLAPFIALRRGLRVPGSVDPAELAIRAVLGQQISVAGARTLGGRLAARYGEPLAEPIGGLTNVFPRADVLAGIDPDELPLPLTRARALIHLTEQIASGKLPLDIGADRDEVEAALLSLPGVGRWTAAYIRMRGLSDPDAFLDSDLGVRHALEALGEHATPAHARRLAERWRPWRAYALHHLWASLPARRAPMPPDQAARALVTGEHRTKHFSTGVLDVSGSGE